MHQPLEEIRNWQNGAGEVSELLRAVGNKRRLIILCHLSVHGEMPVGKLLDLVDLSQSALSQHLAKLRAAGVVRARRVGQTIWYSVGDERIAEVMATLYRLYCEPRR